MDNIGLNVTSISLFELLKLLINILELLANKENGEFQKSYSVISGRNTTINESIVKFSDDLYNKTINFLKNNFKEEDLMQISEKINWKKQELLKDEPLKHSHAFRK